MKKHLFTVAAAVAMLAMAGNAQAQADRKGFIGLGLGASIPSGDFGDNVYTNEDAGFAKTGAFIDLHAGYKFSEVVGGMLLVRGQIHEVDEVAPSPGTSVEADPWVTTSYMIGPFVSFPLNDDNSIAFEARGLVGYAQSRTPEVIFRTGGIRTVAETDRGGGFAWLVGTGVKFNLSDAFGLGLHVDYMSTNPEFEPANTEKFTQPMNLINAGLSFDIGF